MRVERLAGVAIALFLSGAAAHAQEQSGWVDGRVTGAGGVALEGVVLDARGDAGSVRSATLDNGSYRFAWLRPGTYTIHASHEGYLPARVSVLVVLGARVRVDIVLERVDSRAPGVSKAPVDLPPQHARVEPPEVVSRADADRLPTVSNQFVALVGIVRGVFPLAASDGRPLRGAPSWPARSGAAIDGAATTETRLYVDGVDWTDAAIGGIRRRLPGEFVEQVQVKRSGYEALSVGSAGGIVNVVTRAGSDRFRGTASSAFEAEWLLGAVRPRWRINPFDNLRGELVRPARDQWRHNSPAADLGGPIVRGRAWFHAGYEYDRNDYRRAAIFLESPPPFERREFRWYDEARDANVNVTAQVTDGVRVKVAGTRSVSRRRGSAPALQPAGARLADGTPADGYTTAAWDANEVLFDQRWNQVGIDRPSTAFSARTDWVVSASTALRVTVTHDADDARTPAAFYGDRTRHVFGSSNIGMDNVPAALQFARNYADNRASAGSVEQRVARAAVEAEATRLAEWSGRHVLDVGVRVERVTDRENNGEQRPTVTLMWDDVYASGDGRLVSGPYGYYRVSQERTFGRSVSRATALWFQDDWTPANRLAVKAGVRIEDERAGSFTGDPGVRFGFGDKVAPRLRVAYDVGRAGRTTLHGTYGWSYETLKLAMTRRLLGAELSDSYIYTLDTYDWPAIDCVPAVRGCPGAFIEKEVGGQAVNALHPGLTVAFGEARNAIDPALKPGRSGELTLGIDRSLARRGSVGLRYVHKWLTRTVEGVQVIVPGAGAVPMLANPGLGMARTPLPDYPLFPMPEPARAYHALEASFSHRARDWSFDVDYRLASLRGNYAGPAGTDQSGRACPGCTAYFRSPYASWTSNGRPVWGPLPADRAHQLKIRATWDAPWGSAVGALFGIESGTPLSSRLSWKGAPVYYNGRGDLGRTPFTSQLDLLLRHDVPLRGAVRVSLSATIVNVLDTATPAAYATNPWRGSFNLEDDVFFGGWDPAALAGQIRAAGGTLRDNPLYLKPSGYQSRRSIRFSAKVSF